MIRITAGPVLGSFSKALLRMGHPPFHQPYHTLFRGVLSSMIPIVHSSLTRPEATVSAQSALP
jgi:cation transporter-like permease